MKKISVRTALKTVTDRALHPIGLTLDRHFGQDLELKRMIKEAKALGVNTILDVGANRGQFAERVLASGFEGQGFIASFEPLTDAHDALCRKAKNIPQLIPWTRCAIGDEPGEVQINVAQNEHSSSLLKVADVHTRAAPTAGSVRTETVRVFKLDQIAEKLPPPPYLLKIDTQGFEDRVLAGAVERVLPATVMVQLELSLLPLYEGQKTLETMLPYMANLGFKPLFFSPGWTDRTTQEMQQIEGYFVRAD